MKRISQQGIFNENLRRSFEKLVADKRDLHEGEKKIQRKPGMFQRREGTIKFVNSSSESDLDSISPDISTHNPFNRKFKSRYIVSVILYTVNESFVYRCAIRRQISSDSGNSTESSSFKFRLDAQKNDSDTMKDNSVKDIMIFDLRKSVDSLNLRLNQITSENIKLKAENIDLRRREENLSEERNELKNKLLATKDTEINLSNLVAKLSNIVQSQDNEIAMLNEKEASSRVCRNCDLDKGKRYLVKPSPFDQFELLHRLKMADVKLSEQVETNKQLKQYLEILLLKICDR